MAQIYNQSSNSPQNSPDMNSLNISYWNSFGVPFICLFGVCTNGICIYVFFKLKLKNILFKYMFIESVNNFIYLLFCSFIFTFGCYEICSMSSHLATRIYQLYIYGYFTSVLALTNGFLEVLISSNRYFTLKNKPLSNKIPVVYQVLILFALSSIVYAPNLFDRQIVQSTNVTYSYVLSASQFGLTKASVAFVIIGSVIRGPIILSMLITLNILSIYEFRKVLRRKESLFRKTNKQSYFISQTSKRVSFKSETNLSKLVITLCILYIVCNFPNVTSFILRSLGLNTYLFFSYFVTFSNAVLFVYHGLNFFVYYKFNKKFKNFFVRHKKNSSSSNSNSVS